MQEVGGRGWSFSCGMNQQLSHALGVRSVADLPVYDGWVPEPLEPSPPAWEETLSSDLRTEAASQWRTWWQSLWSKTPAPQHSGVPLDPSMFRTEGLHLDPPVFESLASTPALREVVTSTWGVLSGWLDHVADQEIGLPDEWPNDLIKRADHVARRRIADVAVRLEVIPVASPHGWLLVEDPQRHVILAVVTQELTTRPWRRDDWLLDALVRSG